MMRRRRRRRHRPSRPAAMRFGIPSPITDDQVGPQTLGRCDDLGRWMFGAHSTSCASPTRKIFECQNSDAILRMSSRFKGLNMKNGFETSGLLRYSVGLIALAQLLWGYLMVIPDSKWNHHSFIWADNLKIHRIGWWENLQESPIFDGKNHGFL